MKSEMQHFTINSTEINLYCLKVDQGTGTCLKWWGTLRAQVQSCQCRALAGVTQPCGSSCANAAAAGILPPILALLKMPKYSSSLTTCWPWLLFARETLVLVPNCMFFPALLKHNNSFKLVCGAQWSSCWGNADCWVRVPLLWALTLCPPAFY